MELGTFRLGGGGMSPEVFLRNTGLRWTPQGFARVARLGSVSIWLFAVSGCHSSTALDAGPSVIINPAGPTIVAVGDSVSLTAIVTDTSGHVLGNPLVVWDSSDVAAAGVSSDGTVSAIGAGATTITASANGVSTTSLVKVVGVTAAKPISNGELIWLGPNLWAGLFGADAGWPNVQARAHVVKLYVDDINGASGGELVAAVTTLNEAHIAVAVEVGGLRDWECDGARLAVIEQAKIAKFVGAGGAISFLDMDSPFGHTLATGTLGTGIPRNCGFTVTQTSEQLVVYIHAMRLAHPGVRIGLIEPVPWYSVGAFPPNPGNNFADLPQLLDTFTSTLTTAQERIDYFHADSPYDYNQANPDGWAKLVALSGAVRGHDLRFGLILNSSAGGTTGDQAFHDQTLESFSTFRDAGGRSDDILVQSWYPFPSMMVPEMQSFTFTNDAKDLIAAYDSP
jgi:hypothetical protein